MITLAQQRKVVGIEERRRSAEQAAPVTALCANPRCDEQFMRVPGSPGRRRDYHSESCRRSAERDERRLHSQIEEAQFQLDQLRNKAQAYVRPQEGSASAGPSVDAGAELLSRAKLAVAKVSGMARFLRGHQGEFAQDLLEFYEGVEPFVRWSDETA
ncbi:hypothetical protein [Gordonia alkanivorans]|uniref:hypothetical protein n=1 Tax=Gordonia alkanivorans TaxID=84096 RepID=UPI0004B40A82|nr:hypothetical protein [Gordonia alkanivorans]